MGEFSGKTLLITGAARGVGKQTSILFAKAGASVFMVDIGEDELMTLEKNLKSDGLEVSALVCDIAVSKSTRELVNMAVSKYGKIDFLVNNAGVSIAKKMMDVTEEDWDRVLNTNVKGTYFVLMEAARTMINIRVKGSIINIASIAGEKSRPNFIAYAASKAAVISLTRYAALEFSRYGIRVNAISPGTINTPMWSDIARDLAKIEGLPEDEIEEKWVDRIPLKRLAEPADIANTVFFLCSDKASYITGQVINVCGGLSII